MLGRDVVLAAEAAGHAVTALDRTALDVTDARATVRTVADAAPATVVNCAAFTNVDGAEAQRDEAMLVNAGGAGNVAAAAAAVGASVLYISSDYVFDGTKTSPYVESDPTGPASAYGASKLAGETETAGANPRNHIVRSSWLFGPGGRNFVATMLRLGAERDEVTVVRDQIGSPTYTPHLAAGVVELLEAGEAAFGIHHMAAAGECSWYDFAMAIFDRAGLDCHVAPTTTEAFGAPAPRPAYSVLHSERDDAIALPDWREGLEAYLA